MQMYMHSRTSQKSNVMAPVFTIYKEILYKAALQKPRVFFEKLCYVKSFCNIVLSNTI